MNRAIMFRPRIVITKEANRSSVLHVRWDALALVTVCLASLGLVTSTNRAWYYIARQLAPGLMWSAELCIASLTVCLIVYLAIRPARRFALPRAGTDWIRIARISGSWLTIWLFACTMAAIKAGHWIAYTRGAVAIWAFLLFGPIQEELVFRGAIFELTQRVFDRSQSYMPFLISSLFFSLHHFELHHYHATPAALLQVGFTFPMGLVFAVLRAESDSLWPGLLVHFLTNLPGCFGTI